MNALPTAKLPGFNVPTIRGLPNIPTVGCVSGNPTTLVGQQMGSLPDISALPHVKALKKVIEEQIGALVEGKLPQLPRSIVYEVRQLRLVAELAQIVAVSVQIAAQMTAEINAAIAAANQTINGINAAANEIEQLPEAARSAVQRKALDRYNDYAAEINAQIGRLNAAKGCLI